LEPMDRAVLLATVIRSCDVGKAQDVLHMSAWCYPPSCCVADLS